MKNNTVPEKIEYENRTCPECAGLRVVVKNAATGKSKPCPVCKGVGEIVTPVGALLYPSPAKPVEKKKAIKKKLGNAPAKKRKIIVRKPSAKLVMILAAVN